MKQKTKDLYTKLHRTALFAGVVLVSFFGLSAPMTNTTANAATLQIYNHVTNSSYEYSGTQVAYRVNGKNAVLTYPGLILKNGAALGPCKELFEQLLGVTCDYTEGNDDFSLSYGPHTIKMTLGTSVAEVNGVSKVMQNAPIVYSFNGSAEKHLYVPTRFVAETFGFEYNWDATTATSSILKSNVIYDGQEQVKYNGAVPSFLLNNLIVEKNLPGYIFDGCALFPAAQYFEESGLALYSYSEGSGLIVLKKGETEVRLVLDSPVAYVNDEPVLLQTVPRLITPQDSVKAEIYIPAEFVADALGYRSYYEESTSSLYITGTLGDVTGSTPDEGDFGAVHPNTASFGKVLFSYEAYKQVVEHYTALGYLAPQSISAYACLNSDALYLQGIDLDNVKITDKQDVLEIEVNKCHNSIGSKYYYNTDNSFLNYCSIMGTNRLRITVIKTSELQYYAYKVSDGCMIHFTDTAGMYQDYITFMNPSKPSEDTGLAGNASDEKLPDAVFNRDYFVIRLPEGITADDISDVDDYGNKRFTIYIKGNHMEFLSEQNVYNPCSTLKSFYVNYKMADNTTVITFNTTKIQGYSYLVSGGYLGIKIGNPRDIYDKIIVLDAGHGGIDPGTLRGSVYEKTVNYNVVNVYAPEYFKSSDIKVYYTRTTDTKIALEERAAFAASVDADLFISFHVNAHSNSSVNGTSVYYSTNNNSTNASGLKSSTLASTVLKKLTAQWGTKNAGVLTAKFVVIDKNTVPAVLVECGFITNNSDFAKIKDSAYQKKAAKALYDAVTEIFKQYPTGR